MAHVCHHSTGRQGQDWRMSEDSLGYIMILGQSRLLSGTVSKTKQKIKLPTSPYSKLYNFIPNSAKTNLSWKA